MLTWNSFLKLEDFLDDVFCPIRNTSCRARNAGMLDLIS